MIEIAKVLEMQRTILQIELEITQKTLKISKLGPKVFFKLRTKKHWFKSML
jgi:hypothetical protein